MKSTAAVPVSIGVCGGAGLRFTPGGTFEARQLLLDATAGHRSRKMAQIPGEQVLGAADGRDGDVQGIIRNGGRHESSSKQERGKSNYSVCDLKEVAIGNECQALGSQVGIARAGFAHHDR